MGNPALGSGCCPDHVDLPGPAGSDNGKPKSYVPFWALSSVRAYVPIRDSEDAA